MAQNIDQKMGAGDFFIALLPAILINIALTPLLSIEIEPATIESELSSILPDAPVEFEHPVKPVPERRCIVCHGCYDAPCQLKLSSNEGLQARRRRRRTRCRGVDACAPGSLRHRLLRVTNHIPYLPINRIGVFCRPDLYQVCGAQFWSDLLLSSPTRTMLSLSKK